MQSIVLIRHAKSVANEYKDGVSEQGHTGHYAIPFEEGARQNLLNSQLSVRGVHGVRTHANTLWQRMAHLKAGRDVVVYASPVKRALQTCLISLDCEAAAAIFTGDTSFRVIVVPALMEAGNTAENVGIELAAIQCCPDIFFLVESLRVRFKLPASYEVLDFSQFYAGEAPKPPHRWWSMEYRAENADDRAAEFERLLAARRQDLHMASEIDDAAGVLSPETMGEVVVCFTHWGFSYAMTKGMMQTNFGVEDGDAQGEKGKEQWLERGGIRSPKGTLHPECLLLRNDPSKPFMWLDDGCAGDAGKHTS